MKKYIAIITVFLSILWNFNTGICRSWDDLDEGEHEIFGSEKEEKFPVKALFWEMEKWDNHYSNMLFWIYKHTDYPKYRSTRFLPLYYWLDSKIDNRSMIFIIPLLSYFETDGNIEDATVVFPIYGSTIDMKNNNYDRRFLLFWWGRDYSYPPRVKHYQTLFPLSYHSSEVNEKTGGGEYLWVNPLFVSWRDKSSATEDHEHLWWMPIIPFITFNYVDRNEGHRNFILLMDYSWDIVDGKDDMRRFWFMPFIFWKRGDDGYTSILPPVYINNKYSSGDYFFQILPFYTTWKDTCAGTVTNQKLTLLFAKRSVVDEKTGEETYSNLWFPIIPVFFRSNDKNEGTHTNILGIFDWQSDKDGSLKHWDLIPFVMNGSANTEKEGYSWGIFHYHSWSESHNKWWAWPYYSSEEYVNKPAVKGSKEPPEKEEFYYTHFIPLYCSWKSQESTGRLFIPFVFTYQDKQTDFYVNLFGYASRSYMGPFSPQIMAGLEKKDETWYLDGDMVLFYGLFTTSTRVPIRNPFSAKKEDLVPEDSVPKKDKVAGNVEEKKATGIVAKKDINRENSEYFWGWNILFGWIAYERADSWRHYRFLPLAWLTLNDDSENKKVGVFPLFFWYKSEEDKEEYFLFLPFYVAQYQDKSYIKAYLINLYWDEFEAEKDYYEKSVVWPFINWYSSPEKYGFRFFPLFWYRGWKEGSDDVTQTFSLLHYSKSIQDAGTEDYKYRKRINPLYYLREEKTEKDSSYTFFAPLIPLYYHGIESDQVTSSSTTINPFYFYNTEDIKQKDVHVSSTFWAPVIPLYYSYSSADYSHWNFLGIMDRMKSKDYSRFFLFPLYYGSSETGTGTSSDTTLTPLFYYGTEDTNQGGEPVHSSTFWAPVIPLYYTHSEGEYSHWNFLGLLDSCNDKDYDRFFFLPFYYSTQEKDKNHRNILGIIDLWKNEKGYETTMVFPLWWWSGDDKSDSLILFPILSYFNTEPDEKTKFIAGLYLHESKDYERQNFLYIFDHRKFISEKYSRDEYSALFSLIELDRSPEITEMRMAWGALFKYENYKKSRDYDIDAFLWLAGMERGGDYFHHRMLPLYWYSSDKYETILTVPVALSYFSENSNGSFDLGVLGLLYFRDENRAAGEDRRMWLLGTLYNEVKYPERKYHARGSFWGLLWDYETEEETGFTKFTILKGLYKYRDRNGESDHTFFWFL